MLEKCLLGTLIGTPPLVENSDQSKDSSSVNSLKINDNFKNPVIPSFNLETTIPVFDSYQTHDSVNLVFYTKNKNIKTDNLIVEKLLSKIVDLKSSEKYSLIVYVYTEQGVFEYNIG